MSRKLPPEFMVKTQYYMDNSPNSIGKVAFDSLLSSRISQLKAITLPTETNTHKIIDSIYKIENSTERLSSFLDFMVSQITSQAIELYQSQEVSGTSKRLNHIAKLLDCKTDDIESQLLSQKKTKNQLPDSVFSDYQRSRSILGARKGDLYKKMIEKSENVNRENYLSNELGKMRRNMNELQKQLDEMKKMTK